MKNKYQNKSAGSAVTVTPELIQQIDRFSRLCAGMEGAVKDLAAKVEALSENQVAIVGKLRELGVEVLALKFGRDSDETKGEN